MRLDGRPLPLVERRSRRAPARDPRPAGGGQRPRATPTQRPRVARSPVRRSSSSAVTQPRSATTRSTERSGRARVAGSTGSTSRTSPPPTVSPAARLPQDVAVAGHAGAGRSARWRRTRPVLARARVASGAEHAQADRAARPSRGGRRRRPVRVTRWPRPSRTCREASTVAVSCHWPGAHDGLAPPTSSWSTPTRFSGGPAARAEQVDGLVVGLDAPHPHLGPAGPDRQAVADGHRAARGGSR